MFRKVTQNKNLCLKTRKQNSVSTLVRIPTLLSLPTLRTSLLDGITTFSSVAISPWTPLVWKIISLRPTAYTHLLRKKTQLTSTYNTPLFHPISLLLLVGYSSRWLCTVKIHTLRTQNAGYEG